MYQKVFNIPKYSVAFFYLLLKIASIFDRNNNFSTLNIAEIVKILKGPANLRLQPLFAVRQQG